MNIITRLGLKSIPTFSPNVLSRTHATARRHITSGIHRPLLSHEILGSRREAALKAAQITKEEFAVYTDGSGFRGGVGGAARAETPIGTIVKKEHLGTRDAHLPVEGEILGIILGVRIIKTMPFLTRATIFVDCKQAILEAVSGKSRHLHLMRRLNDELRGTRKSLTRIRVVWVPGHEGVEMNELVHKDAQSAALGDSTTRLIISPSFHGYIHVNGVVVLV